MKLAVQSKHDDSGDTNSVLSFYFEYSGDGALWEYFTANGANKVSVLSCGSHLNIYTFELDH